MSDQVLLLIAVNGLILAVLVVSALVMFPSSSEQGVRGAALVAGGFRSAAIKASPSGSTSKVQRNLDRAGNPVGWTMERIFMIKGLLSVASGVLGVFVGSSVGSLITFKGLFAVSVLVLFGFFLPNLLLYRAAVHRQEMIQKDLPDVLDLMTVSMRAGLGFDAAVMRVATNSNGPLSAEFGRMLHEFRLGQSRSTALRSLIARSTVPDLHYVAQALIQADSLGVPVAEVLSHQSKEMRTRRRQRGEEKAQKVTLKILFPLLFCIFPALMVVVIGPAGIRIVHMFAGMQ